MTSAFQFHNVSWLSSFQVDVLDLSFLSVFNNALSTVWVILRRWNKRESRNAYKIFIVKLEGKRTFRRPRRRWEGNNKINLKERVCESVDWFQLVHDRIEWEALLCTVMNLRVPKTGWISCSAEGLSPIHVLNYRTYRIECWTNNWENCRRQRPWPILKYNISVCIRECHENSRDRRQPPY
jgi:hypothetical protein